jgi:hypothetical protein
MADQHNKALARAFFAGAENFTFRLRIDEPGRRRLGPLSSCVSFEQIWQAVVETLNTLEKRFRVVAVAANSNERTMLPGTLPFSDSPRVVELFANGAVENRQLDDLPDEVGTALDPSLEPVSVPVAFLQKLRLGSFWVLTAIDPDTGNNTTVTVHTADQIEAFVRQHNGRRNLYYSTNPTRTAMTKKAAKTDIAAIEYVLGDLDPAEGETSEAAKARYLEQFNGGAFEPKPTAAIDSGNGIHGLWRLQELIPLGAPVRNKKGKLVLSAEDQTKIVDVEARAKTLMLRLGSSRSALRSRRWLRICSSCGKIMPTCGVVTPPSSVGDWIVRLRPRFQTSGISIAMRAGTAGCRMLIR